MPADEVAMTEKVMRPQRPHSPSAEEVIAHQAMLRIIANPIWLMEG
jgi:hypothetical protein